MHERTRFTVAIPTHNRRETVVLAVQSALAQTRPPVEVLVLADGCTDGTVEAVRGLGDERAVAIELAKGEGYAYGNRNEALRRARGDVVSWLSDDDLYLPDHLEQVGRLFDALEVDIVQASSCRVRGDGMLRGNTLVDWRVPRYRQMLLSRERGIPSSAVSHRVRPALEVGGWRDDHPRGGDKDLWKRMLEGGARSALVPTPTVLWFRPGEEQPFEERVATIVRYLDSMGTVAGAVRLQAEMTRAIEEFRPRAEAARTSRR